MTALARSRARAGSEAASSRHLIPRDTALLDDQFASKIAHTFARTSQSVGDAGHIFQDLEMRFAISSLGMLEKLSRELFELGARILDDLSRLDAPGCFEST